MSKDITSILSGWDFDPDEPQVRIVAGDDGREKLQMRLDLGLLQMELSGRPDGRRPFGHESLLDYHEEQARQGEGPGKTYRLDAGACQDLSREGMQYYHRYLALFHLERYDLVARDTERNLRLLAFVVSHARKRQDALQLDQYRPYITMMNARARGLSALGRGDHRATLERIDEAIERIRAFLSEYGEEPDAARCHELSFLRRWRREVERQRTPGPIERLEEQLALAVTRERYEEAARLRDQIRRLRGDPEATGAGPSRPPRHGPTIPGDAP